MTNKFNYSSASALAILSGVVLKNSSEQSKKVPSTLTQLGPLLFALGWFGFAYSTSMSENMDIVFSDQRTMLLFGASASIMIAVFMMKNHMKQQKNSTSESTPMPMMYPMLFAVGWLLLGYNVSENKQAGLVAALLALSSMMFVLPWQRKNKVIDGPGMSMFTIAWVILVYLTSHAKESSVFPTFLQNRF